MPNLALAYVQHRGIPLTQARKDWSGACIDFAGELIDWLGRGRLAYVKDPPNIWCWRYHAFAVVDGIVHDLWENDEMPLPKYLELLGTDEVEYPAEQFDERQRIADYSPTVTNPKAREGG